MSVCPKNPVFEDDTEMNCTMRHKRFSSTKEIQRELVLTPIPLAVRIPSNPMRTLSASERNFRSMKRLECPPAPQIPQNIARVSSEISATSDISIEKADGIQNESTTTSSSEANSNLNISMHSVPCRISGRRRTRSVGYRVNRVNSARNRSGSFPSRIGSIPLHSRHPSLSSDPDTPSKTYTITMSEILSVDISISAKKNSHLSLPDLNENQASLTRDIIAITTVSKGLFEFSFHSQNSQEVLQAFLCHSDSTLHPDQFTVNGSKTLARKTLGNFSHNASDHPSSPTSTSSRPLLTTIETSKSSIMDMEKFTAKEIDEWEKTETRFQKWRRNALMFSFKLNESKFFHCFFH